MDGGAIVTPNVDLSHLHPVGPEIEGALRDIDTAGQRWVGRAEARSLGVYCHRAIDVLTVFLDNLGKLLKVFRTGDGPKKLKEALREVARYLEKKADPLLFAKQLAIYIAGGESIVLTEKALLDEVTEAVRLHVEVVVEAAKRIMDDANIQGRAMAMVRCRRIALQVWYEIFVLNSSTEFGYAIMDGYKLSLRESTTIDDVEGKTIDDVLKSLQDSMDFQRVILGKMEAIGREVDAGRVAQEEEVCPRVFFLVPADTSQWSTLEHLERKSIFTKNMNLVFVCHTFFEEIQAKAKVQRATEEHLALTTADKFQDECSEIIDIKQPRDFFLQHLQAIKLSAQVVKAIGLATAFFGVSVQGVLPDNISDLDDLTEIMETGLEAAVEAAQADENEPITGERAHTRRRGPRWKLKWGCGRESLTAAQNDTRQRMRDKCAHHVLQHYLEYHRVEWKSKVHRRLTPAHNSEYGYTYVCKGNEKHAKMWKERPAGCGSDTPAPSA